MKMKRTTSLTTLLIIICVSLFYSCEEEPIAPITFPPMNQFRLDTSEMVVEVDKSITSFRIEGEWDRVKTPYPLQSYPFFQPYIELDTTKTTARHKVHFINEFDSISLHLIFIPIKETKREYSEVKIIPENIIEPVEIHYKESLWNSTKVNNIKVTLKPKQE